MDEGIRLSEERRDKLSELYSSFPEVTFRDYIAHSDISIIRVQIIDYWKRVNRVDLSGLIEVELPSGERVKSLKVDAKIAKIIDDSINIRLALIDGNVVGFMLYRVAFDCMLAIDGMHVNLPFQKYGIGAGLMRSLEKPIKKLFFQTHISNRPAKMFEAIRRMGCDWKKVHRDGDLITWECNWHGK